MKLIKSDRSSYELLLTGGTYMISDCALCLFERALQAKAKADAEAKAKADAEVSRGVLWGCRNSSDGRQQLCIPVLIWLITPQQSKSHS